MKKLTASLISLLFVASQCSTVFGDSINFRNLKEAEPNNTIEEAAKHSDAHRIELSTESKSGYMFGVVNSTDKVDFIPVKTTFSGEANLSIYGGGVKVGISVYNDTGRMIYPTQQLEPDAAFIREVLLKANQQYYVKVEHIEDTDPLRTPYILGIDINNITKRSIIE